METSTENGRVIYGNNNLLNYYNRMSSSGTTSKVKIIKTPVGIFVKDYSGELNNYWMMPHEWVIAAIANLVW